MSNEENNRKIMEGLSKGRQCYIIRKRLGLTQKEFAVLIGVTVNAVSDWEVNEDTALAMEAILASPVLAVFASEETRKMLSIRITHMNSGKAPANRKLRNSDR